MTSRTKQRFKEDEAIAWQLQYEQELLMSRKSAETNIYPDERKPYSPPNYSDMDARVSSSGLQSSSSLSLDPPPPNAMET